MFLNRAWNWRCVEGVRDYTNQNEDTWIATDLDL